MDVPKLVAPCGMTITPPEGETRAWVSPGLWLPSRATLANRRIFLNRRLFIFRRGISLHLLVL